MAVIDSEFLLVFKEKLAKRFAKVSRQIQFYLADDLDRAKTELEMKKLLRFLRGESGATAIEYGLIAAGISIVIIAGLNVAGPRLSTVWSTIGSALTQSTTAPATPGPTTPSPTP